MGMYAFHDQKNNTYYRYFWLHDLLAFLKIPILQIHAPKITEFMGKIGLEQITQTYGSLKPEYL